MIRMHLFRLSLVGLFTLGMVACQLDPEVPPYPVRVQQIRDSLSTADSYWPGFTPEDTPLAVEYQNSAWLLNHPDPPAGWERVDNYPGAFTSTAEGNQILQTGTTTIDGEPVTALYIGPTDEDSLFGHAAIALKQAYRRFIQERHPNWSAEDDYLFMYPFEDVSLLKWQMMEIEGLQEASKAISKGKTDEALTWLARSVVARDSFDTAAPEFAREYVRQVELQEGLAYYVEVRARQLEGFMMFMNTTWSDAQDVRRRAQVSGAAKALLLDRFLPEWKTTLDRRGNADPSLNDLLRSVANRQGLLDPLPTAWMNEYQQRAEMRLRRYKTLQRTMLQAWNREEGYSITVDASARPLIATGFDLYNVLRLEDDRIFHDRWLRLKNNFGSVQVRDQLVLTTPAGEHPLFSGIAWLEVRGLHAPPTTEQQGDTLVVRWTDGEIRLKQATLEDHEGQVVVTL